MKAKLIRKMSEKQVAVEVVNHITQITIKLAAENVLLRRQMKAGKAHKIMGAVGFFFCLALSIYFPSWSSFELICGLALLVVGWA